MGSNPKSAVAVNIRTPVSVLARNKYIFPTTYEWNISGLESFGMIVISISKYFLNLYNDVYSTLLRI